MKSTNVIWNFFASVKLALFTLCSLAVTSIIGTLIPQKETADFYIQKYGEKTASFLQLFDVPDMYGSWWFISLLILLSLNLLVCSIDRFPHVLSQIKQDNLALPVDRILKMGKSQTLSTSASIEESTRKLSKSIEEKGWKVQSRQLDGNQLLFTQKGTWSRTGVYIVHVSILIIFAGAILGELTGFKGSIMIPELQSSGIIYSFENGQPINLGFEIRCDRFDIEFYSNNAPKEYTSDLVVIQNGKEVLKKSIEVNDPLQFNGITFYQSSYQGYRDFILSVDEGNNKPKIFTTSYQKEVLWKEKDLRFGIINLETLGDRVIKFKVWMSDSKGEPSVFWVNPGDQVKVNRPDATYLFSAKQRYATGLQVAKDPGVWVVYIGCGLMLFGLYLAFFLSHRRIWLVVQKEEEKTVIHMRGSSNKNKAGFDKIFFDLADTIKKDLESI